ncbi:MAG: hypothetical protein OHK0012_15070 [Synechococcales cyanobacterium]
MLGKKVHLRSETRNHRGTFLPPVVYTLADMTESGWALICEATCCHYVDPDALVDGIPE